MKAPHVALVFLCLASCACSAPTLAQRQANWQKFRDVTRATCLVGSADPERPADVAAWCERVNEP